jgi:hypothetical protein
VDCTLIEADLVPFHFGAATETPRAELEAHLCQCAGCLQAFIALKRAVETGEEAARPSAAAQARLREAVALEIAPPRPRVWLWGSAAAALVVAAALLGFFTHSAVKSPALQPPSQSTPTVDSARPEPFNLQFI